MAKGAPKSEHEKVIEREKRKNRKAVQEHAQNAARDQALLAKRKQLDLARASEQRLLEHLNLLRNRESTRAALHDHATGFYQEVDKLAKGKTLMEVTHLVVENVNQIVRDAKAIITGDPFLDRVKEFVPAGDNPVYPDVVMCSRTVLQCLGRSGNALRSELEAVEKLLLSASTVRGALEIIVDEWVRPSKDRVQRHLGTTKVDNSWFVGFLDDAAFEIDRLDRIDFESEYKINDRVP